MTYSVKNVKTFNSPDGGGYNASLYLGKTKVADIHDGGYGGCLEYDWIDTTIGRTGKINPDPHFEKDFYAFLKTQKIPDFEWSDDEKGFVDIPDVMITPSDDLFIGNMVNDFLNIKRMKSLLSRKVHVSDDGQVFSFKCKSSEIDKTFKFREMGGKATFRDFINTKYPKAIILNDLTTDEAFQLWA